NAWPVAGWPAQWRLRRAAAGSARRGADSTRPARRRRAAAAPVAPDPAHTATAWAAPSWHCATAVRQLGSAVHRTVVESKRCLSGLTIQALSDLYQRPMVG